MIEIIPAFNLIEIVFYSIVFCIIIISIQKRKLNKKDKIIQNMRLELDNRYNIIADKDKCIQEMNIELDRKSNIIAEHESNQVDNDKKRKWYLEKKQRTEEERSRIEISILEIPELYYYRKSSCMNKNEAKFFYYINQAMEDLPIAKKVKFYLFPQVSLYAYIGINKNFNIFEDNDTNDIPRRRLGGKNVDFTICCCHLDENDKNDKYHYLYDPVLMIEIDGSSHFSGKLYGLNSFENQKLSDKFKDSLSKKLKIPLLRYQIDERNVGKEDGNGICKALNEIFQDRFVTGGHSLYCYNKNGKIELY